MTYSTTQCDRQTALLQAPAQSAAAAAVLCYSNLPFDAAGRPPVRTPECSFRSVCHMQRPKLSELWCGRHPDCCPVLQVLHR